MKKSLITLAAAVTACAGSAAPAPETAVGLEVVAVGRYDFRGGGHSDRRLAADGISGLARLEGDRYVAVADRGAALLFLEIAVDPRTGRVTRATFLDPVPLSGPAAALADREAVACAPGCPTVWLAGEGPPPWIAGHDLEGGTIAVADLGLPSLTVFATARPNLGFEALAHRPEGGLWAANEEALAADGPPATPRAGTVVRLIALDDSLRPLRQHAYVTDPVSGPITHPPPAVGREASALVELVALPGGPLLALERALGGDGNGVAAFRVRLYAVDPVGATDVSGPRYRAGLADADWTPVEKTLLLELRPGLIMANYEAMALGPELEGGDRSLLLMADNGGGTIQSIYALRVRRSGR
ncbi:MAG TPA: esterase-like activity of phytase family protein [Gemmatimonadota bacterium]|nr:esterase-like activity of phytase family protein [Gemmatimonadota bacterium]